MSDLISILVGGAIVFVAGFLVIWIADWHYRRKEEENE